jgi:hypothetical protein
MRNILKEFGIIYPMAIVNVHQSQQQTEKIIVGAAAQTA